MARTKQTARKATGGRPPRKRMLGEFRTLSTTDHNFNLVTLAPRRGGQNDDLGFFPFQVYLLHSAAELVEDRDLPRKLIQYVSSNDTAIRFNENCHFHPQIYMMPKKGVLECIAHHEAEKPYRRSQLRGPVMLNRKEFMVLDSCDWQDKGVLTVTYTPELLGRDGNERELENHRDGPDYIEDEEDEPEKPLHGLRQDLIVERQKDPNSLVERFLDYIWSDEGHEWRYDELMRKNVAMGWPDDPYLLESNTLPGKPDKDQIKRGWLRNEPWSKEGDEEWESEDWYLTFRDEQEAIMTFGEKADSRTGVPLSLVPRKPTSSESSPLPSAELEDILVQESTDRLGIRCTTVHHSKSPALFSYSIYLQGDKSVSPATLYALLNRDLLERTPWCLHIYTDHSLSAALSHFKTEIKQRHHSPRRPLDYSGPRQSQSQIFLTLDTSRPLEHGPSIVTTDGGSKAPGTVLEIQAASSWSNAAKMLFTYQTFCQETASIVAPLSPSPTPEITLQICIPEKVSTQRSNDNLWEETPEELKHTLELHFQLSSSVPYPITFNPRYTPFDRRTWDRYFSLQSGLTDEENPFANLRSLTPDHEKDRKLSITDLLDLTVSPETKTQDLQVLYPGQCITKTFAFAKTRLYDRHKGVLEVGKPYKICLRRDVKIQRWTWAASHEQKNAGCEEDDRGIVVGDLKGPFGMASIVVRAENEAGFLFVGPRVEQDFPAATHRGLFGRGSCF